MLKEQHDPGHWAIVWQSEFTRLTVDVQPWLHFPFFYYFQRFYDPLFQEYCLLLAAVALPFFLLRKCAHKKLVAMLLTGAAAYIVFISFPPVKLDWYDAPIYPMLCAAMAVIIWQLVKAGLGAKTWWGLAGSLALTAIVAITIKNSFLHVQEELPNEPHLGQEQQILSDGLKILHDRYPKVRSFSILIPKAPSGFVTNANGICFYKTVYQWYEGKSVKVSDLPTSFSTGDTVICDRKMLDQYANQYNIVRLDSTSGGAIWIVLTSAPNTNSNHSDKD